MTQKTNYIVAGIDPGFGGAIAFYHYLRHEVVDLWDMPLTAQKASSGKNQIDAHKLAMGIDSYAKTIDFAVVEEVHAMPGQGVTSMFRFGQGFGIIQGILATTMIPTFYVKPSIWKCQMGLSTSKDLSLSKVRHLFPKELSRFERKKDNGRAEALLLAFFGAEKIARKQ